MIFLVKYLKKIGILPLLFSVAINSNFKAMDGSEKKIDNIKAYNLYLKSVPITRKEKHLRDCAEIGDFKDVEQLRKWLSIFLPDEAVGRFVWSQRQAVLQGDYVCVCKKPKRTFVPILEVLDLMVSFVVSDEAKKFFESKDKEIIVKSDDFGFPVYVKMSKIPALISRMHTCLSVDPISNKLISVPKMKTENFFFTKLTFVKLKNDFAFIVAQIEKQPIIFIRYRNICLSNLVRKQEVSEYKDKDNETNFSYSNKVVEHNGKKFSSFTVGEEFYVFNRKEPFENINIIVEI